SRRRSWWNWPRAAAGSSRKIDVADLTRARSSRRLLGGDCGQRPGLSSLQHEDLAASFAAQEPGIAVVAQILDAGMVALPRSAGCLGIHARLDNAVRRSCHPDLSSGTQAPFSTALAGGGEGDRHQQLHV